MDKTQTRWPWTPSTGELAGQRFRSNREYREALERVRSDEHAVERMSEALMVVIEAQSQAKAAERAAAEERLEADSMLRLMAETLVERRS